MTPADVLAERTYEPFCGNGVLATINALADFSHSKAMADLITAGRAQGELLVTLGKVAPPRYANFIGRYKDAPDASVRQAVAAALGLIDNETVALPVLIQLLSRGDKKEEFLVRWEASSSLAKVAARKASERARRRLVELLQQHHPMTVLLAARALGLAGDASGLAKLRELANLEDPTVRQEAVLALGEAGDRGSREVLMGRLTDESATIQEGFPGVHVNGNGDKRALHRAERGAGLGIAARGYILEDGRTILDGSSQDLLYSAEVSWIFLDG